MRALQVIARLISGLSKHVKINEEGIERFCREFNPKQKRHWLTQAPYPIQNLNIEDRLAYLTAFNAISFSYWGEPKWTVNHNGINLDGAWAMLSCLGKEVDRLGVGFNAQFFEQLSKENLHRILLGNTQIPLFDARLQHIHEIGSIIISNYGGMFRHIVEESQYDAVKLLEIIMRNFSSFQDVSYYGLEKIPFYKRAQLLVSDIGNAGKGKNGFTLQGLENVSACADYKLPFVLRRYGIFEYSDELAALIDNKIEISHGAFEEIEIRANTVHAVELIKERLITTYPKITSMDINDYLWLEGQIKSPLDRPYHRTRTTAY